MCVVLALLLGFWKYTEVDAAPVERLVMPGEVIQGHARYEEECSRCHEPFSKTSQQRLCLSCHKEVGDDINKGTGFHGRKTGIHDTECKHCHTDHKGRSTDIVMLDRELFDHRITDFELKGGHVKAPCSGCHNEKYKNPEARKRDRRGNVPSFRYSDAPSHCIDCHKDHDQHRGQLGDKCADCHEEETWSKTRYNHDKTKFPLKGKHKKASCDKCHPGERWGKTPGDCFVCHRMDDRHNGRYGRKCEACHTTEERGILPAPIPDRARPVTAWNRSIFDHNKTKFQLTHKHRQVECNKCHKGTLYNEKIPLTCYGCHKGDNVHKDKGQEGTQCERCHNQQGWRSEIFFDHDLTRFPLIGLHAVAACEECHVSAAYEDAPAECIKCHESDDYHKQRFGTQCGPCHNPNGWSLWRFDHDSQTRFKLDGAHQGLDCHACHQRTALDNLREPMACFACHMEEDEHRGRFGQYCQHCHNTKSFKEILIMDHEVRSTL
ncbi:MAG: cytochrome c3 family protein [bacterium]